MTEDSKYHVLTPKEDLDDKIYFEALDFALKDDTVHNVAVMGSYGSGKSSVIHSYLNKRKKEGTAIIANKKEIKDISITLSHFAKKNIDQKLVEYAILEQLFFHEKEENLPESQISRIKRLDEKKLCSYVQYVVGLFVAIFWWFYQDVIGVPFPWILAVILGAFFIALAVKKILPIVRSWSIKKISLATASIEVNYQQSILNQHIDEILYFFQQTETNLVVFEDLDRLNNPNIFTKLREINYLINNSEAVNNHVVFIYALKDEMFQNYMERTKFFDFILPIIPFVDGNNAVDKLYSILEGDGIDLRLCNVLSYYIGEMRMVYNIANEYNIYKEKKKDDADFNNNQMLALVAYKNCYPNDFAMLINKQGLLYSIIAYKEHLIGPEIESKQEQILELDKRIKKAEDTLGVSLNTLQQQYINAMLADMPYKPIWIENRSRLYKNWETDELFEYIKEHTQITYGYTDRYSSSNTDTFSINFHHLEQVVTPNQTYEDMKKAIEDNQQLKQLQQQIRCLQVEIEELKGCTYQTLLSEGVTIKGVFPQKKSDEVTQEEQNQVDLIEDLLSFGFINENYAKYLSLFHEGTLTKNDHRFFIDVLRGKSNAYDYHLENATALVELINSNLFLKTPAVWNFDLLDALMIAEAASDKVANFIANVSEGDEHLMFINKYVDHGKNVDLFIAELCKTYTNLWHDLKNDNQIDFDEAKWLHLLLKYAPMECVPSIFVSNETSIANMENYFLQTDIPQQQLMEIASVLNIRFVNLSKETSNEVRGFLYQNNLYAINSKMMEFVMPASIYNEAEFMQRNFTLLHDSGLKLMLGYIRKDMHQYLSQVWMQLPIIGESESAMFELLATPNLNNPTNKEIIQHDKLIVQKFESIPDQDGLVELLFEMQAIAPTWQNLRAAYNQTDELMEHMVTYLNTPNIYEALVGTARSAYYHGKDDNIDTRLARAILYNESLSDKAWLTIIDGAVKFGSWKSEGLSEHKVKILMDNQMLFISLRTYQFLQKNYFGLHIRWMKNNFVPIVKCFDNTVSFTSDEIDLLTDIRLRVDQYKKLLTYIKIEEVAKATRPGCLVNVLERYGSSINKGIVKAILKNKHIEVSQRLPLIIKYMSYYALNEITPLMQTLGTPYSSLQEGKHPLLIHTDDNVRLIEALQRIGYVTSTKEEEKGIRIHIKRFN